MKELKSKRTGRIHHVDDDKYAEMVRKMPAEFMKRFTVTDLRGRVIVPSLKTPIKEVIIKRKKDEG